jgi:hypothetical protein
VLVVAHRDTTGQPGSLPRTRRSAGASPDRLTVRTLGNSRRPPTIRPAIRSCLGGLWATPWTRLKTEGHVSGLQGTGRTALPRTLNPQVLGSNPRGRTAPHHKVPARSPFPLRPRGANPELAGAVDLQVHRVVHLLSRTYLDFGRHEHKNASGKLTEGSSRGSVAQSIAAAPPRSRRSGGIVGQGASAFGAPVLRASCRHLGHATRLAIRCETR